MKGKYVLHFLVSPRGFVLVRVQGMFEAVVVLHVKSRQGDHQLDQT